MKLVRAIVALSAISASAAFAGGKKAEHGTPNCDVNGKKVHVKDEAACKKKKGTWAAEAAAPAEAAPAEAPAAAPAEHK